MGLVLDGDILEEQNCLDLVSRLSFSSPMRHLARQSGRKICCTGFGPKKKAGMPGSGSDETLWTGSHNISRGCGEVRS